MLLESTCPSKFEWVTTDLVECMLDDHLAISVGDSGEQVADRSVGLGVNILLSLGYWLRNRRVCFVGSLWMRPERLARLLDDRLPDMMANSVQVGAQGPREFTASRLWDGWLDGWPYRKRGVAAQPTNRDDEDHGFLFAGQLFALCCQSRVSGGNKLKPGRWNIAFGELQAVSRLIFARSPWR